MSEIKVNKISPRSGTAFTLGDSGDTFTIPSGATINNQGTAVNFGATGSASWVTTVKTSTFTAVAGEGYFVNTTGGVVSVNLPAGVAGAVVAIKDYAGTFDTNAVTLVQNGSDKIGGSTVNATLGTEGIAVTLVFIDSTQGWLVTDSGLQGEAPTAQYVTATGGTITCSGNFRIHTFTGPGALCVSSAGNASGSTTVDYLVAAGGGGGGNESSSTTAGGGGGAGGYRESPGTASGSYTVSPLGASPAVALPVSVQSYSVTVGAGGSGNPAAGGSVSTFSSITSAGGGFGAMGTGGPGGSGGGGSGNEIPTPGGLVGSPGGTGNTPPTDPPQGNTGGTGGGPDASGGGGAGATAVGGNGPTSRTGNAPGGAGAPNDITGSAVTYSAGGAGGNTPDVAGTANTGNGGNSGGTQGGNPGNAGGSGIVIVRGPSATTFSVAPGTNSTSTHPGGDKLATFTVSGTLTIS